MFIKYLMGARAGTIEDVAFENAKQLVENGHAEDVYHQLNLSRQPSVVSSPEAPTPQVVIQPQVMNTRADSVEVGARRTRGRR
jgi:hypothetical protein